jgi:hypothetical protein
VSASRLAVASRRAAVVCWRGRAGRTSRAKVLAETERQVLDELVPACRHIANSGISRPERAGSRTVANRDPAFAHVLETACAGALVVEVGDQLAQNPRLIGIADAAMPVLDDGLRDDSPPGEVVERDAPELAAIDVDRGVADRRGDLVRNGEDGVELVVSSDVEISIDLVRAERDRAGLDHDEARPIGLPALRDDDPVGYVDAASGVLQLDFGIGDLQLCRPLASPPCVAHGTRERARPLELGVVCLPAGGAVTARGRRQAPARTVSLSRSSASSAVRQRADVRLAEGGAAAVEASEDGAVTGPHVPVPAGPTDDGP